MVEMSSVLFLTIYMIWLPGVQFTRLIIFFAILFLILIVGSIKIGMPKIPHSCYWYSFFFKDSDALIAVYLKILYHIYGVLYNS